MTTTRNNRPYPRLFRPDQGGGADDSSAAPYVISSDSGIRSPNVWIRSGFEGEVYTIQGLRRHQLNPLARNRSHSGLQRRERPSISPNAARSRGVSR